MSVLKLKRGESAMQFIETARELEIYTIKQYARFSKRFMFLIMKDIVALAKAVYNNVKAANSVYPVNVAEVQLRKKLPHYRTMVNTDALYNKLFLEDGTQ